MLPTQLKYHNKKVKNAFGEFDSVLEYKRYLVLKDAERRGEIRNIQRQVEYILVPNQYRTEVVHMKTKDKYVEKLIERNVTYVADFVYMKGDEVVVEDTKGLRLNDYVIKRKLMLFLRGVRIQEVDKPGEPV